MGKIIHLKNCDSNQDKFQKLMDKYQSIMGHEFVEELTELESEYVRFKPERLKLLLLIEKLLVKSVSGDYKIKRGMGNILSDMCDVSLKGQKLKIVDLDIFRDAILLGTCLGVTPQMNGDVIIDICLYDMDRHINWDACLEMLLEYNSVE